MAQLSADGATLTLASPKNPGPWAVLPGMAETIRRRGIGWAGRQLHYWRVDVKTGRLLGAG